MTILLITAIGCMYWIYYDRQAELNHKQQEINILYNYRLNEPFLKKQITDLKADNTQLKQQLENLNIKYQAKLLYIDKLEKQYLRCEIYANTAEIILKNNNINFTRIEQ